MRLNEENEQKIQDSVGSNSGQFRNYNPGALKLLRPTLSINKLIGETQKGFVSAFAERNPSNGSFKPAFPTGKSSNEKAMAIKRRLLVKSNDY